MNLAFRTLVRSSLTKVILKNMQYPSVENLKSVHKETNMMKHLSVIAAGLLLTACTPAEQSDSESNQPHEAVDPYSFNENYTNYLKTLSSDEFQGRAPASVGE